VIADALARDVLDNPRYVARPRGLSGCSIFAATSRAVPPSTEFPSRTGAAAQPVVKHYNIMMNVTGVRNPQEFCMAEREIREAGWRSGVVFVAEHRSQPLIFCAR
jgi:hypothetical protein